MIIQLVKVSIRPDQRERWLELIRANVTQTRVADGCERYDVSEDLESPNTFVLVEQWRDFDAQYEHFRTPDFGELMGALQDVLAGPPEVTLNEVARTLSLDEALEEAGVNQ
jgi:quinol monooxygenase YgiN